MPALFKFWHRWRDFIQLAGYFVMLGTILTALYMGFCFIETANATAETVSKLQEFKEDTRIAIATQKEDTQYIKDRLSEMQMVQGKIFERINQIADRGSNGR